MHHLFDLTIFYSTSTTLYMVNLQQFLLSLLPVIGDRPAPVFLVVLPQSGSEPRFEPEPFRTGRMVQSQVRPRLRTEPLQRFGVRLTVNRFERVRTSGHLQYDEYRRYSPIVSSLQHFLLETTKPVTHIHSIRQHPQRYLRTLRTP